MTDIRPREAASTRSAASWLPHRPASVGAARKLLRGFLGTDEGGGRCLETGLLVVSELVSNAVQHARVPRDRLIQVRFELTSGVLRIEVHDASDHPPKVRTPMGEDESGRGLCLVREVASGWGFGPRLGVGKVVWALVASEGGIGS
ncbi:ATP-binding protein [Kitasatospora sp. NPDC052896]|uniref:ATP-binding protein n=1 Tax=Kitasatospora sp. NPDC052896 TaxID=3364061 RepID=UPI0037CBAAC8